MAKSYLKLVDEQEKPVKMLVKDKFIGAEDRFVHVHISWGFAGNYKISELLKWYGGCLCELVHYEKEFEPGVVGIIEYLQIYSDKNFDSEIMEARKNGTDIQTIEW